MAHRGAGAGVKLSTQVPYDGCGGSASSLPSFPLLWVLQTPGPHRPLWWGQRVDTSAGEILGSSGFRGLPGCLALVPTLRWGPWGRVSDLGRWGQGSAPSLETQDSHRVAPLGPG